MKRFLAGLVALVIAVIAPASTYALTEAQLDMFAQNNILFYDPDGGVPGCWSQNLSGDTVMAKVVNYLSGNNPVGFVLSDNAVAGILANFRFESGFNPFMFEGHDTAGPGYGIAQFTPMSKITEPLMSDARTANYFNEYFDIKYTRGDINTGLPIEPVPMEVVNAWLSVQLDFFFGANSEFENTRVGTYRNSGGVMGLDYILDDMTAHEAMEAARTPEDATRIFVWIMERPKNKEKDANIRSAEAQQWLDYTVSVRGNVGGGNGTIAVSDGHNVTMIGDSITVGSESEIRGLLPEIDIYAQGSKHFYDQDPEGNNPGGYTILRELVNEGKLRDILVFALGTNSARGSFAVTLEQANNVVDLAGPSRKVIFMTNYTEKMDYSSNNNVFLKMANDYPGRVYIADWKAAIEGKGYLSDGVHPDYEGRKIFASIIANAINVASGSILTCNDNAINGGLNTAQAERLRDYYNSDEVDAYEWGLYSLSSQGKKNCTAFTAFFVQRFTSIGRVDRRWGNGRDVANNLARDYALPSGTNARPFAVFSVTKGRTVCRDGRLCGHTGIVVSVNNDQITTIEAAYQAHDAEIKVRDISYFENTDHGNVFTYLDGILDTAGLYQIVGN